MSVKIEILDYKYNTEVNLVDVNSGTADTGWTALSSTSASFTQVSGGSGNYFYENISSQNLVVGTTYNLSFEITNYSGNGNIGFSSFSGVPISARFSGNTDGIQYFTFTATNSSFPDLFSQNSCGGTISNISIGEAVLDWDNSVVGELDVTDHSDFPLAMTFQISDIKDITSTSGDYSKTFKIPATKNNNKLLKNPYIPNIDTEVNITENKKCRILVNNLFSITGLIKITGVSGYGETPSHYDCVFFGNNLSWADDISKLYLHELDWGSNSEGLEYTKTKIMATWQHEDCDAASTASDPPIVYPVTSYGEFNPEGEQNTIQLLDTANGAGIPGAGKIGYYGYDNGGYLYGTPRPSPDWRPAVFVKTTLEKIFGEVGYQISSTFMETDMFKKLVWLLPNFKYNNAEERYDEYSYGNSFTGEGLISNTLIEPTNDPQNPSSFSTFNSVIDLNDAGADFVLNSATNNTGWDASTGIYTIQEYGYYDIELNNFGIWFQSNVYNGGALNVFYARIQLQVKTAGQTSWNSIANCVTDTFFVSGSGGFSGSVSFGGINRRTYLNENDQLRLNLNVKANTVGYSGNTINLYLFGSSTPTSTTLSDNANAQYSISLNPEIVDYGQTYDLKDVINKDYKSLDFVKGVAHAFNLKMTTNEVTKVVNIEPFTSFYKDYAEAIDWTYKLDRSKQIDDKWIKSDVKRDIIFKYKSDSNDKKVEARGEQWFGGIKDEHPYRETLPSTFEKGESKYENPFFAGTYNDQDQDSSQGNYSILPYSACLWQEVAFNWETDRPDKGYEFLPRLLYWNKYSPTGVPSPASSFGMQKFATVQTWASYIRYLIPNQDFTVSGAVISNIYPQATSYNKDDISSPILSYGNVNIRDYDDATAVYASQKAGKGLFETYYKNMFEMLKSKPRLRTVYVDLKVKDIILLDFTKLIYIDGVYWRINKVVDYQPNKNQSTKVELIEWVSLGVFAATEPSFGGNSNIGGDTNPIVL